MQLVEHDGKALLARHGIALPRRTLLGPDDDPVFEGDVMVKAQAAIGGRGKAGLVRRATQESLAATVDDVRAAMRARRLSPWILLEECVPVAAEHYLAITIDDVACAPRLLFALAGGVDIEAHAGAVQALPIDPLQGLVAHRVVGFLREAGLTGSALGTVARLACALWQVFVTEDAEQIEINPLVITPEGRALPLDAKVITDDSADPRHPAHAGLLSARLAREALSERGRRAHDTHMTLVEMPGTVAVLTGGAGLGMATLDYLADAGLAPACFVDGTGGTGEAAAHAKALLVMDRAHDPEVRGILVYSILSATSLAAQARGILSALKERPPGKPVVVGLTAAAAAERDMTSDEARAAFTAAGFPCFEELDDAVAELKRRIEAAA